MIRLMKSLRDWLQQHIADQAPSGHGATAAQSLTAAPLITVAGRATPHTESSADSPSTTSHPQRDSTALPRAHLRLNLNQLG